MATTPTQLPVPSEKPQDLKFNAGKIDEFVTSLVGQYIDRFGGKHYTIEGLKRLALQAIYNLGWNPVGTFQSGATVANPGDIVQDTTDDTWYRWDDLASIPKVVPAGSTPASAGGTGEGKWQPVDVSDVLRKELSSSESGKGDSLITVKQPYVGSVSRTQHDKNKDVLNVKDFGAVGDGVTDDTNAIQGAINALSANGGKVLFPQAVIRINGSVHLKSNVDIDLNGCTVLSAGAGSGFYAENENNFSLRNGRIYHDLNYPDAPPPGVVANNFGIGINGCSRFNLDKLDVRGFGDCGIVITSSAAGTDGEVVSYSNISFCNTSYNFTGIKINGSFASEYIHLVGCNAFKNNAAGIHNEAGNITLSACTAASNAVLGLYIKGASNAGHGSATGCNFNHNTGKNILVDSLTQGYMFSGCNIFDDAGDDPFSGMIQLAGCKGVTFSGCQIMANIQVDGLTSINQMIGCSFYGERDYLISSGDDSKGYLIFTNCTQGGGGFKGNLPGVNALYGFIDTDYSVSANPEVVKFNSIGNFSGDKILDTITGICVSQSNGIHSLSFRIEASATFSITLVSNSAPHSKYQAVQIGSAYVCAGQLSIYLPKGTQFNLSIEASVGTTVKNQSTIIVSV